MLTLSIEDTEKRFRIHVLNPNGEEIHVDNWHAGIPFMYNGDKYIVLGPYHEDDNFHLYKLTEIASA
jgi:hypothetical protein